jgi:sigma-B regulation protein RsbU (phosphoserine phosphatase)
MPGMSGVEFCRAYRNLTRGRPGYFILLTAQTEREFLAEGLENGADDFLSKPVSTIELRARLHAGERVLNAQRALAAKNDELSATLGKLSEAYSAIDRDLHEARQFQQSLLPDRFMPFGKTDISVLFRPSGHIGGDMVGYFDIRPGELGLYAVDVSGHGVSSALMTARIASYFSGVAPERNIALRRVNDGYAMLPPDEVCARLNTLLQKDTESDLYLTMVLAHLATETGDVTMCQAGHPSPLILRADGRAEFREAFGMPIGLVDAVEFGTSRVTLGAGDRLLLYSDGITECPDPAGTLLDEKGLKDIVANQPELAGPEFLTALVAGLEEYAGLPAFPDDLSAVLIEKR